MADDLVHRVVAADVLAHDAQLAVCREQAGRVHAAGQLEPRLGEPIRQVGQELARHHGPRWQRRQVDRHLLDRPLAADAARGGRVEAPRLDGAAQLSPHVDRVRGEVVGEPDVPRAVDQLLAVEEPQCELVVVPRRAHRDRDRLPADSYLERLLDGNGVEHAVTLDHRVVSGHAAFGSKRITIDFDVGVLLPSAVLSSGTSAFASGK
jgi:hypothetical protein